MRYIYAILAIIFSINPLVASARSAPWVGVDFNGLPCDGANTETWYGPYDYVTQKGKLIIVEQHHFTPNVENHIRGQEGSVPGDLNYTLMASPNHHRALLSIIRLKIKLDKKLITFRDGKTISSPVECYLQRAINFSPEDAPTYSLFGYYLKEMNRPEEAKKYYLKALSINPDSEKIAYSYSLLLLELKEYDKAVEYAKRAYQNPQTPPGLRNKLKSLGKWND